MIDVGICGSGSATFTIFPNTSHNPSSVSSKIFPEILRIRQIINQVLIDLRLILKSFPLAIVFSQLLYSFSKID